MLRDAERLLDDTVRLRRQIHRHPELGLSLPRTQALVLDALDGLELEIGVGASATSVVAILNADHPGPAVLLRADMDALPITEATNLDYQSEVDGVMHACGHDAHTAMLVAAARLLSDRVTDLHGRVILMFQPGEEGHHGARVMLEEGLLDGHNVTRAFAIHQMPTLPSGCIAIRDGPFLAAADPFEVLLSGRGGHASMPHDALSPIPCAAALVSAIHSMVPQRLDTSEPTVVTVTAISAGAENNVIPEQARLSGTIRTVSESARTRVHAELARICGGLSDAHGVTVELTIPAGYPVTVNDPEAAALVRQASLDVAGIECIRELRSATMLSEDWGYVLNEVSGAMAFLGTQPSGVRAKEVSPNHSNRMLLDENAMALGSALYAAVALRELSAS